MRMQSFANFSTIFLDSFSLVDQTNLQYCTASKFIHNSGIEFESCVAGMGDICISWVHFENLVPISISLNLGVTDTDATSLLIYHLYKSTCTITSLLQSRCQLFSGVTKIKFWGLTYEFLWKFLHSVLIHITYLGHVPDALLRIAKQLAMSHVEARSKPCEAPTAGPSKMVR